MSLRTGRFVGLVVAAWVATAGLDDGGGALAAGPPSGPVVQQGPATGARSGPASPTPGPPGAAAPHSSGELDCRNCHVGQHQGVVRMYLGTGGRGVPVIPSHMLQVRVECIACHVAPKGDAETSAIVGQTFRPSEQACVGCHGEKYRGMLERWLTTLARMREIVAPKLADARAALASTEPKASRSARARRLIDDADFNLRYVAFGKGVHNVFYAADLVKVSNGWLDEAFQLVGRTPPTTKEDVLVRGGYCGVLCHEQAGVKLKETVAFGKQRLPHGRHVTEFGATCTACHSAEVHKAVTATAATCSACHHSPRNDRCESCHQAQAAFYRGAVQTSLAKSEPNVMAEAVSCTACHDFATRHSRKAVGRKCVECHEAPYSALMTEWTAGFDQDAARVSASIARADKALAAVQRSGRTPAEARGLIQEARSALNLVRTARGAHNPAMAEALLTAAERRASAALRQLSAP